MLLGEQKGASVAGIFALGGGTRHSFVRVYVSAGAGSAVHPSRGDLRQETPAGEAFVKDSVRPRAGDFVVFPYADCAIPFQRRALA